jgi:ankyrin repeat protein
MPFMERLHSAFILKTPFYQPHEAEIIEHTYQPFYGAIRTADENHVELMITNGFDVDYHELGKLPPLIYAVSQNREKIVQTLLDHGADPNISDEKGDTALHYAVKLRQYQAIYLLLSYGADKNAKNSSQTTPLDTCREIRDERISEMMNSVTSRYDSDGSSLFELAKKGDLAALVNAIKSPRQLYEKNSDGQTLLHLGVLSGNSRLLNYLINKHLDIDAADKYGITPLITASVHSRYINAAKLLLERHATPDHKTNNGSCALSMAMRNGNGECALLLLEYGANIYFFDSLHTALTLCHNAISRFPQNADQFREIETLLLQKGAHVDIPTNSLKWTPLFHAVSRYQDSGIKRHLSLLLRLGADVDYTDTNGRTPLMLAASTGRLDALKMLLNNYADCDKLDKFGWSALMLSVYYNHYEICSFLLEFGCDVNLSSDNGLNAYRLAVQHNRTRILYLLIDFGAVVEENDS